jgi:signal transduction histidine kinase
MARRRILEMEPADFPQRRPAARGETHPAASPDAAALGGPASLAEAEVRATILIAGAPADDADRLRRALGDQGHRLLSAATSDEALDVFVRERPQLVIVDERLLDGEGADLVRRFRALSPRLPIVLGADERRPSGRRTLIHGLDLNATLRASDDPLRTAETVDCVLATHRSTERVQAENDVRSLVLAKLCHSLRSPLHVIRGYTDILREDPETQPFEDLLERLAGATETALELVRDYLDLARVEAPGPMVRRERVDLDLFVMEILNLAGRQIGDRPLRLSTRVPFAGTCLYTDGEKLRVILNQLLANAIKFSSAGDIQLTVRSLGDSTEFAVADRGPGISREDRPILFTPFRQKLHEHLASTPGQGVGLAIAQRLSSLLGASLDVAPREHGGTVVTLRLPTPLIAQAAGPARTLH